MTIVLHQFSRGKNIPSYSAFCLKLECYFRLNHIPYQSRHGFDLKKAPKGRLPYIEWEQKKIGDSSLIIDLLASQKPQWNMDADLTPEERALSCATQRMLEDHLVRITVHFRWADKDGWQDFSRIVFAGTPAVVRYVVGGNLQRRAATLSWNEGWARHTKEELLAMARNDIQAFAQLLGGRPFFLGNKPHSIDCVAYGVLAQFVLSDQPKVLRDIATQYPTIVTYVQRMHELFMSCEQKKDHSL